MRLGLAGVGRIGALHARTLAGVAGVESLVLADADAVRAKGVAAELSEHHPGVVAADTVDELFTAGLDGLVVATGTDSHAPLLLRAVEAGLPTFCEKPVAPDVEGTLEVLAAVRASGVPVHVGFQRRYDAGYLAARAAVVAGELGWLHTVRSGTVDPAPPHPSYLPTSGGIFRDCTVHDFDVVRWLTGREVVEVYAVGANRGEAFIAEAGDVDAASALLTLDDGTFAHVAGGRYNGAGYDVRTELLGSKGSVAVGLSDAMPLRSAEPGVTFPAGPPVTFFMDRFTAAYRAELEHFARVAAGQAAPGCTVEDALEAFYVAEACELSRREHRPVRVEEVRR